jgi:hypothetical protein
MIPLQRLVQLTAAPRQREADVEITASITRVVARLWRGSRSPCLERSILLHRQLGLAGSQPVLVLGLNDRREGHAWVELDGRAILEPAPPRERYHELMRFDVSGRLIDGPDDSLSKRL